MKDAQQQGVIFTLKGKPIAVLLGTDGMDLEQLELSMSEKFWKLVKKWRKQKTMSRAELDRRLAEWDRAQKKKAK